MQVCIAVVSSTAKPLFISGFSLLGCFALAVLHRVFSEVVTQSAFQASFIIIVVITSENAIYPNAIGLISCRLKNIAGVERSA